MAEKKTSWIWYLLPILFSILGGIIGYFLLKDKDAKTAKNLIIVGLVVLVLELLFYVVWNNFCMNPIFRLSYLNNPFFANFATYLKESR